MSHVSPVMKAFLEVRVPLGPFGAGLSVLFADRLFLHIDNGKTDLYTDTRVRR
jgi:hypothetical protein